MAESDVEEATLEILKELGYKIINGPDISPDGEHQERTSYSDVVLVARLENAIKYLNPKLTKDAIETVSKKVTRLNDQELIVRNNTVHKYLTDGIDIEYRRTDGKVAGEHVILFDFENPEKNEFLAVNQFTIIENGKERRPDILLFVNGIPLVIIELKNPTDEGATIWTAYDQVLGTYAKEIPTLFDYNEIVVISDGIDARTGTFTSPKEWFVEWKTINHNEPKTTMAEIELLTKGMFSKDTILDLIAHFIVFKNDKHSTSKILAAYHQYNAVTKSILACTGVCLKISLHPLKVSKS